MDRRRDGRRPRAFLGVPLAAGYLTRRAGVARKGVTWYEERFLPKVSPLTLYGLLFTIVVLFALQGETITARPGDVARIALPLVCYFAIMWTLSFVAARAARLPDDRRPPSPSRRRATTSSSRSRCPSPSGGCRPDRRWPEP